MKKEHFKTLFLTFALTMAALTVVLSGPDPMQEPVPTNPELTDSPAEMEPPTQEGKEDPLSDLEVKNSL